MHKRFLKIFAATMAIMLSIVFSVQNVGAEVYENITDLGLTSKSAILMEADSGTIIYEINSHEKMPPASVTKVMTLLLIFEAIDDGRIKWDDMVTVSEHAASMGGSQVFLEPSEQQTVRDMVKCITIASANDASVAMAEYIAGSEDSFVELMNKKAKELGMNDTNFLNACGLDVDGHVTSAYDIAIMSKELITKHPTVKEFTTIWMDSITHKTRKGESEFGLSNTNKLLKWYDGATGLKTGSTSKALYCLSGTAEKNGMELVGVVMAAPDFKVRFHEVIKLFDYGYANYTVAKGRPAGDVVGNIGVYKGKEDFVDVVVKDEKSFLIPKTGESSLEEEIKISESISAPFEEGSKIGEIIYTMNGEEKGRCDVVTSQGVEKASIATMVKRMLKKW